MQDRLRISCRRPENLNLKFRLVWMKKKINAKSIMGTIALNMQEGQTALITADGKDEAAAVEELAAVLA